MRVVLYLGFIGLCSMNSLAQEAVTKYIAHKVVYFEGTNANREHFFGIAPDSSTAQSVIMDFNTRNRKNKHKLTYHQITTHTIFDKNTVDVYASFLKICPKGYGLLPFEKYKSISIAKKDNMEDAILYYLATKKSTFKGAKKEIHHLVNRYAKYMALY